ncbi:MAG: thiamine diphosphokinase, partial [Bacteroidales bacterium]
LLRVDTDQNCNDLTKAINYCIEQEVKQVIILGATGHREDHTIANISLLAQYSSHFEQVQLITNYGRIVAINEDTSFDSFVGQTVSIFSLDPLGKLKFEGLKYQLNEGIASHWWSATLNESIDTKFSIYCTHPVIVYQIFSEQDRNGTMELWHFGTA